MIEYNASNNQYRRAIEALRSGVPNKDAVLLLPPKQNNIEAGIQKLLDINENNSGLIISGSFGSGKSHFLKYIRQTALCHRYVVSQVSVNKESPLSDLKKLYELAVESSEVSDKTGNALLEIAHAYSPSKAPRHNNLLTWLDKREDIDPRFMAATLLLCDDELQPKIVDFLCGQGINASDLRKGLKRLNIDYIKIGSPYKNMDRNRFEYLSMLYQAAGYNGWLILIDEADMIASYSPIGRVKAYNNLAWLYGKEREFTGLKSAISITNDYASVYIYGTVNDRIGLRARYNKSLYEDLLPGAECGMDIIQNESLEIDLGVRFSDTYNRLKEIYRDAYGWDPEDVDLLPENSITMRRHIRYCINQWDFLRLTGEKTTVVADDNVYILPKELGEDFFSDVE